MHIGDVAKRSGIPAPTIRFYEAEKLITRPARSEAGYRLYSERILDELTFIRRAQGMGLTLEETREILSIGRSGTKPCSRVTAICVSHLAEIDRRMKELEEFRSRLLAAHRMATTECGFTAEGFCRAILSGPDSPIKDKKK
jgi:MerR family copper efflux transcriptional regulator